MRSEVPHNGTETRPQGHCGGSVADMRNFPMGSRARAVWGVAQPEGIMHNLGKRRGSLRIFQFPFFLHLTYHSHLHYHHHSTISSHFTHTQLHLHPMISSFQPSILAVFPRFDRAKKGRPGTVPHHCLQKLVSAPGCRAKNALPILRHLRSYSARRTQSTPKAPARSPLSAMTSLYNCHSHSAHRRTCRCILLFSGSFALIASSIAFRAPIR